MKHPSLFKAAYDELSNTKKPLKWIILKCVILRSKILARFGKKDKNDYLNMQRTQYQAAANVASVIEGKLESDCVAAVDWEEQNNWPGYKVNILDIVTPSENKVALEYGCGPGRNIINWSKHFSRIDGVDISKRNLDNVVKLASFHLPAEKQPNLFLTTGDNCGSAKPNSYDLCFSIICMQHIASHSVRFSIITSLFSCLKPSGTLVLQFGYKADENLKTVSYHSDVFNAGVTNGACDVRVDDPLELIQDLESIGFVDVETSAVSVPDSISSVFEEFIFVRGSKPAY